MSFRLPQNLFAEALWEEWLEHYGIIRKERLLTLLKRYNLKLREDKTLEDLKLAFSHGLENTTYGGRVIETSGINQLAEEIDKVCAVANWNLVFSKRR